ncbi:hypothetical protein EDD86DRAFT_245982 [Gorgonomyces haynaldii]|nr:hypothetical protein EDD86DRAFT_245982 [Gorgonomyces haynaldii]
MRKFEQAALIDEELHDLKLRFELLGAFTELDSQTRASMTELEKFDHKICEMQKKYDELQAEARAKENKLRGLTDQLGDLRRESETLNSNMKDSPQAKEIRMLENRLDKAMIKYNETQSIRKTYELIVKRLQEERLTFDNQLANFEKSLRAKKQDAAELELMSRDANHAKEVAKAELARFEQQINEERKQREKDLAQRKEMVKQKLEIVLQKDDQNADAAGKDDTVQLDEATEKKMAEYEETMRLIKEATGVSDITEVIAKFQSQGDTLNHLTNLKQSNEERIEQLKAKKAEVMKEYEVLRFTGEAKQSHGQKTIDEFKKHMEESKLVYLEAKQKYERSLKVMRNAVAGPDQTPSKPVPVNQENVIQPKDPNSQQPGEAVGILQVNPALLPTHNTQDEDNDDEHGEVLDRESIKKQTMQMLNARLKTKQPKKTKKKKNKDGNESS